MTVEEIQAVAIWMAMSRSAATPPRAGQGAVASTSAGAAAMGVFPFLDRGHLSTRGATRAARAVVRSGLLGDLDVIYRDTRRVPG
jgi:hypothetical protein